MVIFKCFYLFVMNMNACNLVLVIAKMCCINSRLALVLFGIMHRRIRSCFLPRVNVVVSYCNTVVFPVSQGIYIENQDSIVLPEEPITNETSEQTPFTVIIKVIPQATPSHTVSISRLSSYAIRCIRVCHSELYRFLCLQTYCRKWCDIILISATGYSVLQTEKTFSASNLP